jgi:hypothetical protein
MHRIFSGSTIDTEAIFDSVFLTMLMVSLSLVLFYLISKRVYDQSTRHSVVSSLLMLTGFLIALHLYYGVVFFVSMWTL